MIGPYKKFKLIYKGSRDGFNVKDFNSKCDYVGETVSIIQTTQDRVFGGYTNIPWNSSVSRWVKDQGRSFIFSKDSYNQF